MAERSGRPAGRGNGKAAAGRQRSGGGSSSLYERYKEALRRGHVAVLRERFDAAIDAYGEAASIAPDRALPHTAIGGVLVSMTRLTDALTAYDRAVALAPRDEAALRGRADVLASLGRRAEAAEALDEVAAVLDEAGRLPDAADAARRALELAESRERRRNLESIAARLRDASDDGAADEALSRLAPVLEPRVDALPPEPPPDGIALGSAAEAALAAGDTDAARDGLVAAARAHRAAGRSTAAIDACNLALAVAPADIDLHLLLAELYIDRGWRAPAIDKLVLLGRLAELVDDPDARTRLCAIAAEHLADEPRLTALCA